MMQSLIESVKFWFKNQAKRAAMTEEERYLSESTDLTDFEARQQKIMYNQAPYQYKHRHWLDSRTYQ